MTVVLLLLAISGCAQNVWFKQNASNGDFERDRFECLKQSQQRVGAAQVNAYGGSAVNTVATNDGLFSSCMGSKDWRLQNKDATQNLLAQSNANQTDLKQKLDQISANLILMCRDSELSEYYKKTACKAPDVTFEQLTDKTNITSSQKIDLLKQRARVALLDKEQVAAQALRGSAGQKIIDVLRNYTDPNNDQNNLELYNGQVTWGEYNKRRKEISVESQNLIRK